MSIQRTHWDDCWKSGPAHYECALNEIQILRDEFAPLACGHPAECEAVASGIQSDGCEGIVDWCRWCAAIDRAEKAEAEVERLREERDDDRRREYGYSQQVVDALTKERERYEAEVERLKEKLFTLGAMNEPPCFACGYNGAGYYQPEKHPCAARHHAARGES